MGRINVYASISMLLILGWLAWETSLLPEDISGISMGSSFMPNLTLSVMAFVALILGVSGVRAIFSGNAGPSLWAKLSLTPSQIFTVICTVAFALILPRAGFWIATPAYLLVLMALLGEGTPAQRLKPAVPFAAIVTLVVYFFFAVLLQSPLP
ncbi:tripartite tricarboxylate transporter TctB family protein [Desulfovibrio sp. OttesenSCG-928-O18]|nr:tripartite tricarboxylate transporter TctB family protein [Desulfovibrio sp. OttesenSCG-928-O18]